MKFVMLLIVAILMALEREACQTESKGKNQNNLAKKHCGKAFATYNFGRIMFHDFKNNRKIELVMPWTVLVKRVQLTSIEYCVGVLLEETIILVSPRCVKLPVEDTGEYDLMEVFLAEEVAKKDIREKDGLRVMETSMLTDPPTEDFGRISKLLDAMPDKPKIQPICGPEKDVPVDAETNNGRIWFVAKLFRAKILDTTGCREKFQVDASDDEICVESQEANEEPAHIVEFATGPLVCYDKKKKIWSLQGQALVRDDGSTPFIYKKFSKLEEDYDIKARIDWLNDKYSDDEESFESR